jgi:FkbM family methyltransferase
MTALAASLRAHAPRVEDVLCRLRLYRPARNTYQRLFNREVIADRRHDREFFAAFVPAGGLVFDVGANEGRLTETFYELGARVVAIEPNPDLATRIRARYGSSRVHVESAALGAEAGVAQLLLGRDSEHSTLSDEWQAALGDEGGAERWTSTVEVPVTSLDILIDRYGTPDFVKIDVEGFEPQVLSGLHRRVPALSFEFQCRAIDIARRSVETVDALGGYEFNLGRPERGSLAADGWTDAAGVLERLEAARAADPQSYGDVYARLRSYR